MSVREVEIEGNDSGDGATGARGTRTSIVPNAGEGGCKRLFFRSGRASALVGDDARNSGGFMRRCGGDMVGCRGGVCAELGNVRSSFLAHSSSSEH